MGFIAKYPYTDFHELNLDYLLQVIKSVETTLRDFVSLNAIKYADPIQWSITRQYEKNTVVIDPLTGTAYISVAPVPIGAALTRTEYWTVVFDLEQFVTKASENFANTYEAQTTTTATQATPQYGWLVWGGILYVANTAITPGDAYVENGNITRITVEDICGHIETLNTTDKSNLVAAVNEVLATLISTAGDLNSLTTTDKSNLVAAINEVITTFDAAVLDIQTDIGDLANLTTTDKTSLVNAINEVLSDLVSAISTIDGVTGDLANLTTTDKTSLVNAINEVLSDLASAVSTIDGVTGDLANLTTTDKTSLVNAINEVLSDLASAVSTIDGVTGDLANLTTTDKTSLVNAINEVLSDLGSAVTTIDGVTGDLANLTTTDKTSLVNAINEIQANLTSYNQIVTPEQYGAVGDGITDDTTAFNAAIASGKVVLVPKKTYLVDTLNITGSSITITGTGKGSIITARQVNFDTCNDVNISSLCIKGYDATVSKLVGVTKSYHVTFDDVYLTCNAQTTAGIVFDGTDYCYYNTFNGGCINHFATAVILRGAANSNIINNVELYDDDVCISIDACNGVKILNNTFQYFKTKAISMMKTGTGSTVTGVLISGNYFEPDPSSATLLCDIDLNNDADVTSNFIIGNKITYRSIPHVYQSYNNDDTILDATSQTSVIRSLLPGIVGRTVLSPSNLTNNTVLSAIGNISPVDIGQIERHKVVYKGLGYNRDENLAWMQFIHADASDDRQVRWYSESASAEMYLQPVRSGPTASRPNWQAPGYMYFDTDLGKPIWSNGTTRWFDATGTEVT